MSSTSANVFKRKRDEEDEICEEDMNEVYHLCSFDEQTTTTENNLKRNHEEDETEEKTNNKKNKSVEDETSLYTKYDNDIDEINEILTKHVNNIGLKKAKLSKIIGNMSSEYFIALMKYRFIHDIFDCLPKKFGRNLFLMVELIKINKSILFKINPAFLSNDTFISEIIKLKYHNDVELNINFKTKYETIKFLSEHCNIHQTLTYIIKFFGENAEISGILLKNNQVKNSFMLLNLLANETVDEKVCYNIILAEVYNSIINNNIENTLKFNDNVILKLLRAINECRKTYRPYGSISRDDDIIVGYIILMKNDLHLDEIKNTYDYRSGTYYIASSKCRECYNLMQCFVCYSCNGNLKKCYETHGSYKRYSIGFSISNIPNKYSNNYEWINQCKSSTSESEMLTIIKNTNNNKLIKCLLSNVETSEKNGGFNIGFLQALPDKIIDNKIFYEKLKIRGVYNDLLENMKTDMDILYKICKNNIDVFLSLPDGHILKQDKSLILQICHDEEVFESLDENFKDDVDVSLKMVKKNWYYFPKLSEEMRNNKAIAYHAINARPYLYNDAGDEIKNDEYLSFLAVTKNKNMMRYIPERISTDTKFIISVINHKSFTYSRVAKNKVMVGFTEVNSRKLFVFLESRQFYYNQISQRLVNYNNMDKVKENLYTLMLILKHGYRQGKFLKCARQIGCLKYSFAERMIKYLD